MTALGIGHDLAWPRSSASPLGRESSRPSCQVEPPRGSTASRDDSLADSARTTSAVAENQRGMLRDGRGPPNRDSKPQLRPNSSRLFLFPAELAAA